MPWRCVRTVSLGLCVALLALDCAVPALAADHAVAEVIRRMLDDRGATTPVASRPGFTEHRATLRRFYATGGDASAWTPAWRNEGEARGLIDVLRTADSHGLNAQWYGIDWIVAQRALPRVSPMDQATLDIAMTLSLLRLLHDIHAGRIDPRSAGVEPLPGRRRFDPAGAIQAAREQGNLLAVTSLAAPRWPMYQALRVALARYRELALTPARPPIPDGPPIYPGQSRYEVAWIHDLLVDLGDMASAEKAMHEYDGPIVEAVRRFQRRHGLDDDGIVGRATKRALNVSPAARVRQIELALERMRWLPRIEGDRAVGVNVAGFTLWAVDMFAGEPIVRLQSKVIVGRAPEARTPLFATFVRGIELNPYWNVPDSIMRKEILPLLRRDDRYLEREEMEIVTRQTRPSVLPTTAATIAELARGMLRVRQRPGAKNALGRLKLLMPNDLDIYLHDTPERALFGRVRRDFSHGCIRVENIAGLAAFLLENVEGWDEPRIQEAVRNGVRETIPLRSPVPVVLFYTTVVVERDGAVHFLPDIYGHDAMLEAALAKRAQAGH